MKTARALVQAYVREAAPLEGRGEGGPEQLAAGAEILALDDDARAEALVCAYQSLLPHSSKSWTFGRSVMLGVLATRLARSDLPLSDAQILVMAEAATRVHSPALGPCDYDVALLKVIERRERIAPKTKAALRALAARRGTKWADDRRISKWCAKLIER